MTDSPADRSATLPASGTPTRPEKRSNLVLRELIDEMMASIRAAVNRELWTAEERAQYEDELSMIMKRVRQETVHVPSTKAKE